MESLSRGPNLPSRCFYTTTFFSYRPVSEQEASKMQKIKERAKSKDLIREAVKTKTDKTADEQEKLTHMLKIKKALANQKARRRDIELQNSED